MIRPTQAAARDEPAAVMAGGAAIGSDTFTLIARVPAAGAVEDLEEAAALAVQCRAGLLDIGRAWQTFGPPGVAACQRAGGPPMVCSVADAGEVASVAGVAGMLRVPAGALAGTLLARALARAACPVLLDRGPADMQAWLRAARRIEGEGGQVVLCAPGGGADRAAAGEQPLDLATVPSLRAASGLPLLVDAGGAERDHRSAAALARAAAAVCADGVVVAVDPRRAGAPAGAGAAGMTADELEGLSSELEAVSAAVGRRMAGRRIRYVGGRRGDDVRAVRRWRRP